MNYYVNNNNKIAFLDKLGYGAGNFSTGIAMQVIGAYLVFYCTAILGIPGSLVGIAVSLSIVWDAVTDPLMGYFSDITNSRTFGRRHLYLLIGGFGIAVTNLILWNIDSTMPVSAKFAILLTDVLAVKTFMTIYITPYTALGAELSSDYNERTSIQGIKTIFFLIGLAFVSVVGMYIFFQPTSLFPVGQLNPQAYKNMGLFSSSVVIVFAFVCFISTKKYIPALRQHINRSNNQGLSKLFTAFKRILANDAFRFVALAYMFNNIASALLSNIGLHVFTYTFMLDSRQIAVIIGVQLVTSILSQPFWTVISGKLDKKPAVMMGLIACIIGSAIFTAMVMVKDAVSGSILYFLPFTILAGFGMGALFSLPLSMTADIIDLDELNTGERAEGTYYGCLTLFYKLSQSVTLFLIGFLLDIVKFNPNLPVQSEGTVISLGLLLCVGSAISFIAALINIAKYKLDRTEVKRIQAQIADKQVKKLPSSKAIPCSEKGTA
ncbi:MAG: MFS transporter [Caulobacteraceae bacterium]